MSKAKRVAVKIIEIYRNYLSPLKMPSCRYYPTCSMYTEEAIVKYGVLKGIFKGALRILRCHPFARRDIHDPLA